MRLLGLHPPLRKPPSPSSEAAFANSMMHSINIYSARWFHFWECCNCNYFLFRGTGGMCVSSVTPASLYDPPLISYWMLSASVCGLSANVHRSAPSTTPAYWFLSCVIECSDAINNKLPSDNFKQCLIIWHEEKYGNSNMWEIFYLAEF